MNEFESHQEHTQYTHNAFCKIVIRHAAIAAALSALTEMEQEILFLHIRYYSRIYGYYSADMEDYIKSKLLASPMINLYGGSNLWYDNFAGWALLFLKREIR